MDLYRSIPITKLREPELAARTEMDDAQLDDLAQSIRELGIIEPLNVRPCGDGTYEVVAGHRRLLASRVAGLTELPCRLLMDDAQADAVKLHENLLREDLSPVDEATFYVELYEKHGRDTDRVAELVRRPRAHVERRLLLIQGDGKVLDALRRGAVTLGVAEELNRITREQDRAFYLDHAERGGCSVRQAREWRAQANARAEMGLGDAGAAAGVNGSAAAAAGPVDVPQHYIHAAQPYELSSSRELRPCMFCQDPREEWQMFRKFVCQPCANTYLVQQPLMGDPPRQPVAVSPRARAAREERRRQAGAGESEEANDEQA